jgi:hypothetical protein
MRLALAAMVCLASLTGCAKPIDKVLGGLPTWFCTDDGSIPSFSAQEPGAVEHRCTEAEVARFKLGDPRGQMEGQQP